MILYFLVRVNIPAQAALAVSTETVPCQLQAASSPVSEPVIIDGIVTGLPLLNLIEGALVSAYNNSTSELLDTALTNAAGYYTMSFLFVGMEHAFAGRHAVLYPNPAAGCQNLHLQVSQAGIYQATITGGDGNTWLREVSLEQGLNQLSITGSPEGLNVICLTNGNETYTVKGIQTSFTGTHPQIVVGAQPSRGAYLKSATVGLSGSDSILLVFSKEGYETADTVVSVTTFITINKYLQQIPTIWEFWANALTVIDGSPINNATVKIQWGDGTTTNYTSNNNGWIHILRENTFDTTTNILISNADTTTYQEFLFGTKTDPLITTMEFNLFQTPKEHSPALPPNGSGEYIYPTPAPAQLTELPDTFEIYFVPNIVYDNQNVAYNTRGTVFRTVARCRAPPDFTKKWEYTEEVAPVYLFEVRQGLSSQQIQDQKAALDSTETQLLYLQANGRQLIAPYQRIEIYTKTEPEWIEALARGMDQTHRSEFGGYNQNSCTFTTLYSWSGKNRFNVAYANYTLDSEIAIKMEELIQSFTHACDPPQGGLSNKVVNPDGSMTSFGKALHIILIADPETDFW